MDKQEAIEKFKKGKISTHVLAKFAEVDMATVYKRLRRGISPEEALKLRRVKAIVTSGGYPAIMVDGATKYLHVIVAERALGRKMPSKAVVHHFDGSKDNYSNKNLVICESQKYHGLLHLRQRAMAACGNARYRQCKYCREHDDPGNADMYICKNNYNVYHRSCRSKYRREHYHKNKQSTRRNV